MSTPNIPLILVPCFSGAPWDTDAFLLWKNRILVTGQLPDAGGIDNYADLVARWAANLDEYVLVGDSFGAFVALALAERQPRGLRALVMSGGFARAYVSTVTKARLVAVQVLGQLGYPISIAFHVRSLGSRFDLPGTGDELRRVFLRHSDARTFIRRGKMVLSSDLRPGLSRINVPTLILMPEDDRLIGPAVATELRQGIPGAEERVLPQTGHLLRFTHEREYAATVDEFLIRRLDPNTGIETRRSQEQ